MTSSRQREISGETRRRLLDAAFDLASEGGSSAMSIQAVAERSGISRGSVAWHFGSKNGLLVAVVEEAFEWGIAHISEQLKTTGAPSVAKLIEANFSLMTQKRARIFSTILLEALADKSTVRVTYAASYVKLRAVYVSYLKQFDDHAQSADALAVALLGGTLGINIQFNLDPSTVDRTAAISSMSAVYGQYFKTEPS